MIIRKLPAATIIRVSAALESAAQDEFKTHEKLPKVPAVIMRALQDALDTMRRMPDAERRWLRGGGSPWPGVLRTPDEREAGYWQAVWLVLKGLEPPDSLITPPPVSPLEIATMEDVFTVFRENLVGRNHGRDWAILSMVAQRKTAKDTIRKLKLHISQQHVSEIGWLQCAAIGHKLIALFPDWVAG